MKPIASTIFEIDTLEGDEVKAKISVDNAPFIMRSMADLYSDRELACIREYSTNAYDSNVEKALRDGHAVQPIHVTLPNAMNPYFTVQDFGVGMSEETMREVYLTFGESSKRDSDDFNGMLGFGSKSAVAYTNTFTVTSVHKGIKTVGVVSRREDAFGGYLVTMKLVIRDLKTTEPDGVTIQIPVHNWREFESKANNFYRFWQPGRVLLNGRAPKWAVGERIDEGLYYTADAGNSWVVMGNVPYIIKNPEALFPKGMNRISFVAYVEPCDCSFAAESHAQVEFVPAREALKYSDHTKHHLHKIIDDFVSKSVAMAKKEIEGASSHPEAFKAWTKWRKVIGSGQVDALTFRGDKLVDTFDLKGQRYDSNSYRYGTWGIDKWNVGDMSNTVIITDFDINLSSAHKTKVKQWLKLQDWNAQYYIFTTAKTVDSVWVDPMRVVDWERVKAEVPKAPKKPRVANVAPGRKAGTFDLVTNTGTKTEQDVPSTKELWYIMVADFNKAEDRSSLRTLLAEFDMKVEVVKVPANRKDKFLRFYPHAKDIMTHFKSIINLDGVSLLSDDAKIFLRTDHTERATLAKLSADKIADPELAHVTKIINGGEDKLLKDYKRHFRLANLMGLGNQFKKHKWNGYWDCDYHPLAEYPLSAGIRNMKPGHMSHAYIYLNSAFKARKDGLNV